MVLLPNMGDDGFREFSLRKSGTSAKISFVWFRLKLKVSCGDNIRMKVEILHCTSQEVIATYDVRDLSILDFQEWKDLSEPEVIPLNCLKSRVAELDAMDPETREPVSGPKEVDFYLPDPLKKRVISRLTNHETETEESPDPESVSTSVLKSSTILSAVVTEILHNHNPHSDYKVRISDG